MGIIDTKSLEMALPKYFAHELYHLWLLDIFFYEIVIWHYFFQTMQRTMTQESVRSQGTEAPLSEGEYDYLVRIGATDGING